MDVKLVVANGKLKGRAIPLPGTVVLIGRAKRCHLRPRCPRVSKLHCAIARWAGKVVVRDLHSCNGTFVNGRRVQGEMRIQDGDSLQIGTLAFTFQIQDVSHQALLVPVVRRGEVHWLMEGANAGAIPPPPETCPEQDLSRLPQMASPAQPAAPDGQPEITAGDYLVEYFHKRA